MRVTERLGDFCSRKTRLSGESRERLAGPGGPEDANLGLILRVQTKKIGWGCFWDPESPTIALINQKGISGEFAYGYHWCWRGEETWNERTTCPAREWNKDLRVLHDGCSAHLLEIIAMPIPMTGSACARDGLRKYLNLQVRSLVIALSPPLGILRFDLDFRPGGLRRIILHLHHPAAGFASAATSKQTMIMRSTRITTSSFG